MSNFIFTIQTTTSPQTFTLPLYDIGTFNCTVDWGDAGPTSSITAWNDPDSAHIYATAGVYIVQISGTCPGFTFQNGGDKNLLKTITSWGTVGFIRLNFAGCSNLTSLPNESGQLTGLDTFGQFAYGTAITAIPSGIFDGDPSSSTNYYMAFGGCTSLATVPADMFGTTTNVYNIEGMFKGCTALASVPAGLLANLTSLNKCPQLFSGCTGLTSIPSNFFANNTACVNFAETFRGSGLTAIPATLFDNNLSVTYFDGCFRSCSSLTGAAPLLWTRTSPIPGGALCFSGDSGLSNYSSIPTNWGGTAPLWSSSSSSSSKITSSSSKSSSSSSKSSSSSSSKSSSSSSKSSSSSRSSSSSSSRSSSSSSRSSSSSSRSSRSSSSKSSSSSRTCVHTLRIDLTSMIVAPTAYLIPRVVVFDECHPEVVEDVTATATLTSTTGKVEVFDSVRLGRPLLYGTTEGTDTIVATLAGAVSVSNEITVDSDWDFGLKPSPGL